MKPWEYRGISIETRIFTRVETNAFSGCLIFTGSKNQDGYGQVKNGGKTIRVHKWVWEKTNGAVPNGLEIRHSCNNPSCIYIGHMSLGTHKDNMQDKVRAGNSKKMGRGIRHPRAAAKLDAFKAARIKALVAIGETQTSIAARFRVHKATINDLVLGKTWAHVGAAD